jgi:hypothetical protein
VPASEWKHEDWAYWEYDSMTILVCNGKLSVAYNHFCHELSHCLCELIGRDDLSGDENFINMLGGLLAQVLTSAEY